jgi:hypothetical protein
MSAGFKMNAKKFFQFKISKMTMLKKNFFCFKSTKNTTFISKISKGRADESK